MNSKMGEEEEWEEEEPYYEFTLKTLLRIEKIEEFAKEKCKLTPQQAS